MDHKLRAFHFLHLDFLDYVLSAFPETLIADGNALVSFIFNTLELHFLPIHYLAFFVFVQFQYGIHLSDH